MWGLMWGNMGQGGGAECGHVIRRSGETDEVALAGRSVALMSCASESEPLPASLSHLRVSAIGAEPPRVFPCERAGRGALAGSRRTCQWTLAPWCPLPGRRRVNDGRAYVPGGVLGPRPAGRQASGQQVVTMAGRRSARPASGLRNSRRGAPVAGGAGGSGSSAGRGRLRGRTGSEQAAAT